MPFSTTVLLLSLKVMNNEHVDFLHYTLYFFIFELNCLKLKNIMFCHRVLRMSSKKSKKKKHKKEERISSNSSRDSEKKVRHLQQNQSRFENCYS